MFYILNLKRQKVKISAVTDSEGKVKDGIYVNVFFDFLLQKSLAGTLPATLEPFADSFTRRTAHLANARLRPFCAVLPSVTQPGPHGTQPEI